MNKTFENRDIEQDAVIEYLKPKKVIISDADKLLECPCAKNNIKLRTNYDKITSSVESLASVLVQFDPEFDEYNVYGTYDSCDNREEAIKLQIEWLQKECDNGK